MVARNLCVFKRLLFIYILLFKMVVLHTHILWWWKKSNDCMSEVLIQVRRDNPRAQVEWLGLNVRGQPFPSRGRCGRGYMDSDLCRLAAHILHLLYLWTMVWGNQLSMRDKTFLWETGYITIKGIVRELFVFMKNKFETVVINVKWNQSSQFVWRWSVIQM